MVRVHLSKSSLEKGGELRVFIVVWNLTVNMNSLLEVPDPSTVVFHIEVEAR